MHCFDHLFVLSSADPVSASSLCAGRRAGNRDGRCGGCVSGHREGRVGAGTGTYIAGLRSRGQDPMVPRFRLGWLVGSIVSIDCIPSHSVSLCCERPLLPACEPLPSRRCHLSLTSQGRLAPVHLEKPGYNTYPTILTTESYRESSQQTVTEHPR